jgi:hypothetical protein
MNFGRVVTHAWVAALTMLGGTSCGFSPSEPEPDSKAAPNPLQAAGPVETTVTVPPLTWGDPHRFTVADAVDGGFGWAISLEDQFALVSAPFDDDDEYRGSAFIFVRSGTSWSEAARLSAADGQPYDYFGKALALSGDLAAVAAPREVNTLGGGAYVFRHAGSAWSFETKLSLSPTDGAYELGRSIAADGDTVLLGENGAGFANSISPIERLMVVAAAACPVGPSGWFRIRLGGCSERRRSVRRIARRGRLCLRLYANGNYLGTAAKACGKRRKPGSRFRQLDGVGRQRCDRGCKRHCGLRLRGGVRLRADGKHLAGAGETHEGCGTER